MIGDLGRVNEESRAVADGKAEVITKCPRWREQAESKNR